MVVFWPMFFRAPEPVIPHKPITAEEARLFDAVCDLGEEIRDRRAAYTTPRWEVVLPPK